MPVPSILARYAIDDILKQAILNTSKQVNEWAGTPDNTEFVIRCRENIKEILGERFTYYDYSYDVISDNELPEVSKEECREENSYLSDIWITIKE